MEGAGDFDEKKEDFQLPELLGVQFDLQKMQVKIKPDRRERLKAEIAGILKVGILTGGHASKLKGKLQFAGCSLFGKIGRSFLRPLSERQYETQRDITLNPAIELALKSWYDFLLEHAGIGTKLYIVHVLGADGN